MKLLRATNRMHFQDDIKTPLDNFFCFHFHLSFNQDPIWWFYRFYRSLLPSLLPILHLTSALCFQPLAKLIATNVFCIELQSSNSKTQGSWCVTVYDSCPASIAGFSHQQLKAFCGSSNFPTQTNKKTKKKALISASGPCPQTWCGLSYYSWWWRGQKEEEETHECRHRAKTGYSASELANNGLAELIAKGNLWHLYS